MNKKSFASCIIILFVSSIVLYYAMKDDYLEIVKQITSISKIHFILAFLIMIIYWLIKAYVMTTITKKLKPEYTYKKALRMVVETNFFHAVTPFSSGGQPYEIYSLKKEKIKIADATNISIQNFIVYQIALVFLGTFAVIWNYFFHIFPKSSLLRYLVTLGFICNLGVTLLLFVLSFSKRINEKIVKFVIWCLNKLKFVKNKEKWIKKLERTIYDFNSGAKLLMENKKEFVKMILCNFVALILFYLIPWILFKGTNADITLTMGESILASAYVMMVGSFVPIPGGSGGLEYAFVVFYSTFIKGPVLNAIMLLWRFVTYYFGMIVGTFALLFKRKEN